MKDQMLNVAGTCSCVVIIQCCSGRLHSPRLICCPYLRMTWIVSFKGETSVSTDPRHFTWMMTPLPLTQKHSSVSWFPLCSADEHQSASRDGEMDWCPLWLCWFFWGNTTVSPHRHHLWAQTAALKLGFGCRCPCTSFSTCGYHLITLLPELCFITRPKVASRVTVISSSRGNIWRNIYTPPGFVFWSCKKTEDNKAQRTRDTQHPTFRLNSLHQWRAPGWFSYSRYKHTSHYWVWIIMRR